MSGHPQGLPPVGHLQISEEQANAALVRIGMVDQAAAKAATQRLAELAQNIRDDKQFLHAALGYLLKVARGVA